MRMTPIPVPLSEATTGPVLIKVGGSLLTWPELPARLATFLASSPGRDLCASREIVLIAGGGPAADVIRNMDQIHSLGDLNSHRLAIGALDLTAEILAAIVPGSVVVHRPEALRSIWNLGKLPILSPGRFLEDHDDRGPDPLPSSWDVTSDSIAARIAIHLNASRLILLKSRALPRGAGRAEAASLGLVDPRFPVVARELGLVVLVCLRDAEPTAHVLLPDPLEPEIPPSPAR